MQETLDNLAELSESVALLQDAINKSYVPLEEAALGAILLQTRILKERYEILRIERVISQAPIRNQNRQN